MPGDATMPIASVTQIDWAFAGTSTTAPATDDKPEHTTWAHWVDSTTPDAESVKDEGDMIRLPSGDAVERGQMVNPNTGKVDKYEESWVDIKPLGEKLGWVIKAQGQGARGILVRIGGFAQGILRRGSEVGIKRWRHVGGEQGWDTIVAIGNCDVPAEIFGAKCSVMEEGDTFVDGDGLEWVCIEKFKGNW
ncbi:hypothetical protein D0Z07_3673 [Hyphodiscus hymeniophilus]|uniref:Protein HRI1 n=1 Tax=Hyphodiscus hymeniophilus TaxID=353542 RepID=A0A9P7AXQ2_9HELO|nr:hypothetical protein D0Z07_3673 [Hyphodiscus hymeniophilus]